MNRHFAAGLIGLTIALIVLFFNSDQKWSIFHYTNAPNCTKVYKTTPAKSESNVCFTSIFSRRNDTAILYLRQARANGWETGKLSTTLAALAGLTIAFSLTTNLILRVLEAKPDFNLDELTDDDDPHNEDHETRNPKRIPNINDPAWSEDAPPDDPYDHTDNRT